MPSSANSLDDVFTTDRITALLLHSDLDVLLEPVHGASDQIVVLFQLPRQLPDTRSAKLAGSLAIPQVFEELPPQEVEYLKAQFGLMRGDVDAVDAYAAISHFDQEPTPASVAFAGGDNGPRPGRVHRDRRVDNVLRRAGLRESLRRCDQVGLPAKHVCEACASDPVLWQKTVAHGALVYGDVKRRLVACPNPRKESIVRAQVSDADVHVPPGIFEAKYAIGHRLDAEPVVAELIADVSDHRIRADRDLQLQVLRLPEARREHDALALRAAIVVAGLVRILAQIDSPGAASVLRPREVAVGRLSAENEFPAFDYYQAAPAQIVRRFQDAAGWVRNRATLAK